MGEVAVIGYASAGNFELVEGLRGAGVAAALLAPATAFERLGAGDDALVRLDVLKTLDGVEPGLELVAALASRGVRIRNRPESLLTTHDKLRTMEVLADAQVPHPRTRHLVELEEVRALRPPLVLKPRYGSWGTDVWRCRDERELRGRVEDLAERRWFRRHGVLAQELLPSPGHDLRLLVAGGRVVGAARRIAAVGEWRTNVSVGGNLAPLVPPAEACSLALRAARAAAIDFVGIDVLPLPGRLLVLELNGAADFESVYSQPGRDVYSEIASALALQTSAWDEEASDARLLRVHENAS